MGGLGRVIPLLRASHIQPTLAVTAIVTTLSLSTGRGAGSAWVALAVLSGQLSVGWSNDYLDRDRDRVAARIDKPIVAGQVSSDTVRIAAVSAIAVCVPLSMMSGWRAGSIHLLAVTLAWTYNGWLKNTAASVMPYTLAFGMLPAFVTLGVPDHPWPPMWATIAAGLLGSGAHFVNTLPDLGSDADTGVRGLAHRIGPQASLFLGGLFMASATVVLAVAPAGGSGVARSVLVAVASAAVIAVVVAGVAGHWRSAWSLTLVAAGLDVAVIIASGGSLVA